MNIPLQYSSDADGIGFLELESLPEGNISYDKSGVQIRLRGRCDDEPTLKTVTCFLDEFAIRKLRMYLLQRDVK